MELPPTHLIVVKSFGKYQRGDIIGDPHAIREILSSENQNLVIKVRQPELGED